MSKIEVQLAHEKTEWSYAVYVMHPTEGCKYSKRFEYDAGIVGSRDKAKKQAVEQFKTSIAAWPGCTNYRDF